MATTDSHSLRESHKMTSATLPPPPSHPSRPPTSHNNNNNNNINGDHHQQPSSRHPPTSHNNHINGDHHQQQQSSSSRPPYHPPHPHPHPHQNQYYPRYSSSRASLKGCCCCIFLLLTFLGLLLLAVVLIIVLAVKPKKPQFELQQVGVQYVGITTTPTPTTTSASLSLSIRMIFTAENPNKVGIKYSPTKFYVMYRGVPLGVASVPGFYQPAHSIRQVETTVGVDKVNLLQTDATDLIKDATLNDRVELKVTGDVGAKIRILDFNSPTVKVTVDCAVVISPRKQSLSYKQCGVDGLNV